MSLPTGRGDVASITGVLLSKARTGCGGVMVIWRECTAEEKACQFNILGGQSREEDWQLFTNGDQPRWHTEALQLTAMLPVGTLILLC
jgi:hypothetical protein